MLHFAQYELEYSDDFGITWDNLMSSFVRYIVFNEHMYGGYNVDELLSHGILDDIYSYVDRLEEFLIANNVRIFKNAFLGVRLKSTHDYINPADY